MNPQETPHLETTEEVMFFDTDAGGVVHNIAYLRFIETCRTRLAVHMGMDITGMMAVQQYPVVVRTEIDYRLPAKFADILLIRGWLDQLERARFWFRFEVLRASDGARLITCRQSLALVEMPKGKPLRVPAEWRQRWPHLTAAAKSEESAS
jgi:YbgC/YbaW family acyl-CoA thioester hydrolase